MRAVAYAIVAGLSLAAAVGFRALLHSAPALPELVAPTLISLGAVDSGTIITTSFRIGNRGSSPLILSGFRAGCGCIDITNDERQITPNDKMVLQPGEDTNVFLRIQLLGKSGAPRTDSLTFISNDPQKLIHKVDVQSNLTGYLLTQPQSISILDVPESETTFREIEIIDTDGTSKHKVIEVKSQTPEVVGIKTVENIATDMESAPDRRVIARVKLAIQPPADGRRIDTIVTYYCDGTGIPYGVIPVAVQSEANVKAAPETVMLPRMEAGEARYSCRCLVQRRDQRPFALTVVTKPDFVEIEPDLHQGDPTTRWFTIRGSASAWGDGVILLRTSAGSSVQDRSIRVQVRRPEP